MTILFQPFVIQPGAGGFGPQVLNRYAPCKVVVQEQGGVPATFTLIDKEGVSVNYPLRPSQATSWKVNSLQSFSVVGNGSSILTAVVTPDEDLDLQSESTTSSTGDYVTQNRTPITPSPTLLYTCPPGFKANLLRMCGEQPTSGSGSMVATVLFAYILPNVGARDWISSQVGTAWSTATGASIVSIGQGPGNDIIIPTGNTLIPGDKLYAYVDVGAAQATYEVLQVPL